MSTDAPVVVAGAGIAGLTAALALAAHGFVVELVERAERLEDIGAGLQLSPNALRILGKLGVLDELRPLAMEADAVNLRDLATGRRIASVPVRGDDGTPYLSVHRADLQAALVETVRKQPSIRLRLGTTVTGLEGTGSQIRARLSGDVEEKLAAPILIAADGVRSRIADALGHQSAEPSGYVAWRLALPASPSSPREITAWLAPGCHVVAYPIAARGETNVVVVAPENATAVAARLRSAEPFLDSVRRSFDLATPWPILEADRRRRPSDPAGCLLIGDAAHAMTPFAAQGAAMAIEDGWVAAVCLAEGPDAASAWRRFEAMRRPRWERVRRRAAFHRRVYHLRSPLALARNAALRLRSPAALARDLGWLYDWRPPEIANCDR